MTSTEYFDSIENELREVGEKFIAASDAAELAHSQHRWDDYDKYIREAEAYKAEIERLVVTEHLEKCTDLSS